MLVFETANATCGIMIPYALSRIIKSVTTAQETSMAVVAHLRGPLLLFVALCVGELVFGRLAGAIQIRLGPRQRQSVTRIVYHYLQHHSYRYFSSNFAGALAHRISETSMGVTQTLWALITEFWPIAIAITVAVALLFQAHAQLGYLRWPGRYSLSACLFCWPGVAGRMLRRPRPRAARPPARWSIR